MLVFIACNMLKQIISDGLTNYRFIKYRVCCTDDRLKFFLQPGWERELFYRWYILNYGFVIPNKHPSTLIYIKIFPFSVISNDMNTRTAELWTQEASDEQRERAIKTRFLFIPRDNHMLRKLLFSMTNCYFTLCIENNIRTASKQGNKQT